VEITAGIECDTNSVSQMSPTNKHLIISPSNAAHKTLLSKPLTPLLRLGNH
jgi:hypothetical protein